MGWCNPTRPQQHHAAHSRLLVHSQHAGVHLQCMQRMTRHMALRCRLADMQGIQSACVYVCVCMCVCTSVCARVHECMCRNAVSSRCAPFGSNAGTGVHGTLRGISEGGLVAWAQQGLLVGAQARHCTLCACRFQEGLAGSLCPSEDQGA